MASANGFSVDPVALNTEAGNFAAKVPVMAARVQRLTAASTVDTGNPSLDALIARLAGQIMGSVGGMGKAIQGDAIGLAKNATSYVAGDQASVPTTSSSIPGG